MLRRMARVSFWVKTAATAIIGGIALTGCVNDGQVVPMKSADSAVQTPATDWTISRIEVAGGMVCPFTEFQGAEALLVLPPGSSGDLDTPSITVGGTTLKAGDQFNANIPVPLDGGFSCGGAHYENAVLLVDSTVGPAEMG